MELFGFVILKSKEYDKLLDSLTKLTIENIRLNKKLKESTPKRDNRGRFSKS